MKKILKFAVYDQMLLIHGSKKTDPKLEYPKDWQRYEYAVTDTAILLNLFDVFEEATERLEVFRLDKKIEEPKNPPLLIHKIITEQQKISVGDHEDVNRTIIDWPRETAIISVWTGIQGGVLTVKFFIE